MANNLLTSLKNNKMQMIIFILLISLLVLVLYFNVVLRPLIVNATTALTKAGKINSDLKTAEADVVNIKRWKANIDSFKEKVDEYEKMLPAEQEIPNLLEGLSSMAKSSNIKIVGITPMVQPLGKDEKSSIYKEIPILISAKSGYHELGTFLSKLENSDRFMKVVDIEITHNAAMPKKHDVELIVCTYVLLQTKTTVR